MKRIDIITEFDFYKLSLQRKTCIIQNMTKIVTFWLLSSFYRKSKTLYGKFVEQIPSSGARVSESIVI